MAYAGTMQKFALGTLALVLIGGAAFAEEKPARRVLVELFTSQG